MGAIQQPTAEMGPYAVEMRSSGFHLQRRGETADGQTPEQVEVLLIEPGELPAFRAALMQVKEHPHIAAGRWDTSRSWLTADPPHSYTPQQIAEANAPWQVRRFPAAVQIGGPLWNPHVYASGAFLAEIEYARLDELLAALDALETDAPDDGGPPPGVDLEAY